MKGTENHHCAFISTIRGSWRRAGHCMWKSGGNRHSTLCTRRCQTSRWPHCYWCTAQKEGVRLTKPVWMTGVLYPSIRISYHFTGLEKRLWFQEIEASRHSRSSPQKCGNFVILTHRPFIPSSTYSWYSNTLTSEAIPGPYWGRKY